MRNYALARAMDDAGMGNLDLASAVGVSRNTVSRWVNGRAWPSVEGAVRASRALGRTVEHLFGDMVSDYWEG